MLSGQGHPPISGRMAVFWVGNTRESSVSESPKHHNSARQTGFVVHSYVAAEPPIGS